MRYLIWIALGSVILLQSGCAVKNSRLEAKRGVIEGILREDHTYHPKLLPEEYVIEESDSIEISVLGNAELTKTATVRPDGVITYDLIGTVPVAGKTVSQAEKYIEEKLAEYVKDAKVSIQVTSFTSKNIYVFGRVNSQGPQPFTGKNTVLDVISKAGGVSRGASIQNILVVRQDPVNPRIIPVNFKALATKGLATEDLRLKPNDIVLVTPNIFGRTEEVVATIILPVNPISQPIFTLSSIDDTFGLNLSGEKKNGGGGGGTSQAAASLAATQALTTAATTTTPATTATTTGQ